MTALALIAAAMVMLVCATLMTWRGRHRLTAARARRAVAPRSPRRVGPETPHWLYEYDHRWLPGRVYIGISSDPDARHRRHTRAWWFPLSTGTMRRVRLYPTEASARAAERATILEACANREPLANTHHVPKGYPYRAAAVVS